MVDWGERAIRHAEALTRDQFMSDEKTQDAVSKCISNVGEAANRAIKLEPAIKEQFPEFEAEKAYAAGNVISHDYFALDAAVLWATVKQSIPKFVADARAHNRGEEDRQSDSVCARGMTATIGAE